MILVNRIGNDGNIVDYVPKPQANVRFANPVDLQEPHEVFCSTCIANQRFYTSALANYLPEKSSPDYKTYISALDSYKANLEERFPLVCSACLPGVRQRIKRNNYVAKSTTLGQWLEKKEPIFASRKAPWHGPLWWGSLALWIFRGILWWAYSSLFLIWYIFAAIYPERVMWCVEPVRLWDSRGYGCVLYAVSQKVFWYSFFIVFWHYKWREAVETPQSRVTGRMDYLKIQLFLQTLRLLFIHITRNFIPLGPARNYSIIATTFFIISGVVQYKGLQALVVEPTPSVKLTDDRNGLDVQEDITSIPLPQSLQSHSKPSPFTMQSITGITHRKMGRESSFPPDMMDWSPETREEFGNVQSPFSLYTTTSQDTVARNSRLSTSLISDSMPSEHPPLASQRYFPRETSELTGLESLFSSALGLEDEPLVVRTFKAMKRENRVKSWVKVAGFSGFILIVSVIGVLCIYKKDYYSALL